MDLSRFKDWATLAMFAVMAVLIVLMAGDAAKYQRHAQQIDLIESGNATVYLNLDCPKDWRQDLVCTGYTYAPGIVPNTTGGIK